MTALPDTEGKLQHEERWTLPATAAMVAEARRQVRDFATAHGADLVVASDMSIAVSEAVTNAVMHAYVDMERGPVEIVATAGPGEIVVRVRDRGRGMQPHHDSPGLGVGLPMIGQLAATVEISGPESGGTEVAMSFDAPGVRGPAAPAAEERVELLARVAEVTEGAGWPFAGWQRLLDLLVPDIADACTLDIVTPDEGRQRLGARVDGERSEELSAWLAQRQPDPEEVAATSRMLRDGEPRIIRVDEEALARLARDGDDERRLRELEAELWVNLPLESDGRLMGSLGLGFRPGRDPEEDMPFLRAVAQRASLGLANAQLVDELRRSAQRFERMLGALSVAITVNDEAGKVVYANDAAVELLGAASVEEVLAAAPGELAARFLITHEDGSPVEVEELPGRRLMAGEEAPALLTRSVERVTGREYWIRTTARLLDDEPRLAVNILEDVTEAQTAGLRQRFLVEAGELLLQPRSYEETLEHLAQLAVPQLADWCAIDLRDDDGGLERVGLAHADPAKVDLAREMYERWPPDPEQGALADVLLKGRPQLFRHVTDEMLAERSREPDQLELMRRVGLQSAIIVPIAAGTRTVGVLTMANAESRRRFDEDDLSFAVELGRRAGVAIQAARLAGGGVAPRDLDLVAAAFDASPIGLGVWDRDLRFIQVNRALAEINGIPVEEHLGRTLQEVVPDLDADIIEHYRDVFETGEPRVDVEVGGSTAAAPGERRYWRASTFPVIERDGEVEAIASVVTEITAERRIDEARRALEVRLAEKRSVLEGVVAQVPVGIAVLWEDELRFRWVNDRWFEFHPPGDDADPVGRTVREVLPHEPGLIEEQLRPVFESGEPLVVDEHAVVADGPNGRAERFYKGTTTPIKRDGQVRGVLSVLVETTGEVERRRRLESELAAEQALAQTLQRALLPDTLPRIPGMLLGGRYRPAGYEARVGGDFYDVFGGHDAVYAVVGDIAGKGPEAASRAAFVRSAIRVVALEEESPAVVLDRASEALAAHAGDDLDLCTALCVRVDAAGRLRIAAAGHPAPLYFGRDGGRPLEVAGPILGLAEAQERDECTLELEPGEGLVLYTDGLTDAAAPHVILDEHDLARWASELWEGELDALLDGMLARAIPPGVAARDDAALLALARVAAG